MKNIFILLILLFFSLKIYSQEAVWNKELFLQANKNHLVRQTSSKQFQNIFSETQEIYDDAKKKTAEIMVIHDKIYNQLHNVHSLFKQSKKVEYIFRTLNNIKDNGAKALSLSKRYPQYAIWLNKRYEKIYSTVLKSQKEIQEVFLASNKDILMDSYDRDLILEKIYGDLRRINIQLLDIISRLEYYKSVSYINSIPILSNYYNTDKIIIKGLLDKYKRIK